MTLLFNLFEFLVLAIIVYLIIDIILAFTVDEKVRNDFDLFQSLENTHREFSDFVLTVFESISVKDKTAFLRIRKPTAKNNYYRLQVKLGLAWNSLFQSWSESYFYSEIPSVLAKFGITDVNLIKVI